MRFNQNKEYSLHKNTVLFPMVGLEHQYGRRFFVLVHQHGRRDVWWKRSISKDMNNDNDLKFA